MKTKTKTYTKIVGLKVDIPEPKQTIDLLSTQIVELLAEKYRMGSNGKEYNLITKYANAIVDAISKQTKPSDHHILISYSHVRNHWIKAAVRFFEIGKIGEENGGITIDKTLGKQNN